MDLETWIEKRFGQLLLLIIVLVIACPLCYVVSWRLRMIVLDIPKPPGTQVTVTYQWDSLDSVWEEQAFIPESAFESPEEVQRYYTTELAKLGWFPFGEDGLDIYAFLPTVCNNRVTDLNDDQRRQYSLQLYSTEGGPGRYAPAPPELLCLYVKDSTSKGFYVVRLFSIRPSLWAEFNT